MVFWWQSPHGSNRDGGKPYCESALRVRRRFFSLIQLDHWLLRYLWMGENRKMLLILSRAACSKSSKTTGSLIVVEKRGILLRFLVSCVWILRC